MAEKALHRAAPAGLGCPNQDGRGSLCFATIEGRAVSETKWERKDVYMRLRWPRVEGRATDASPATPRSAVRKSGALIEPC